MCKWPQSSSRDDCISCESIVRSHESHFDTYATYYNIITGSSYVTRYAVHQYDWSKPFTYKWITGNFEEWKPPESSSIAACR
jgi:hypothetical protein